MIDPIQFRPYDPSTDNRAIAVPNTIPGFQRNTQRIQSDMQNFNQAERENDRVRETNAKLYGQDLARLGQFSESLTKLMTQGAEMYIESEKTAAATDSLLGDTPVSEEYEVEEQAVKAEGAAEEPQLEEATASGLVSSTTARNYKGRSIWYQWERAKLDVQTVSSTLSTFLQTNQNTEVTVDGRKLTLATATSAADFAAVQTALTQRFIQESGLGNYNRDLLAKYGRENIQTALDSGRTAWAEQRAKDIAVEEAGERADVVTGIANGDNPGQGILERFPKTTAGRRQAASAILLAVQTGRMDPQKALDILGDKVTTPGGTKTLSEMFPTEFGASLRDEIVKIDQARRRTDLNETTLQGKEWMAEQRKRLAELAKNGTYLTDEQQAELIVQGKQYGLSEREIDELITTTSEKAKDDATMRAEKALQNPGLGAISEADYNLLDPLLQQKLDKAGLSPDTATPQPTQKQVTRAEDVLGARLATEMQEKAGDPQNRTEEYKIGVIRASDRFKELFEEEYKSNGGNAELAARDAMAQVSQEIRENPDEFTKPFTGDLGQKRQERIEQLTPFVDDPSKAETETWATSTELQQAKEALESGGDLPWIYRWLASGNKKVTARQLAEQQLNLAGIAFTPSTPPALEGIIEASPEQFQELLSFKPTLARATQFKLLSVDGLSPNDPQVLDPGLVSTADLSTTSRSALNVIGRYESDSVGGYDAVNQIGLAGGRSTGEELGAYSGPISQMPQHGGRKLTDFSVGEILDLQRNNTMSNSQWIQSGRLHAVGRYQFIGPTFRRVVRAMGISRDTKFTPELQDMMALWLLRNGGGGIRQWIGPSDRASLEERNIVRQAELGA